MNHLANQALEKVDLAGVYLDDGAPRRAAQLLHEAAALLEELADERDRLVTAGIERGKQ